MEQGACPNCSGEVEPSGGTHEVKGAEKEVGTCRDCGESFQRAKMANARWQPLTAGP
jgi:hypothetical protein